jgi:ribonuclease BN (tRNA processing enzyme)
VKVLLVPSSVSDGDARQHQYLTSYLINDRLAVDAGSLGLFETAADQFGIRHVLITHTHIDHIAALPILIDNTLRSGNEPLTIHGSEMVLDCLRRDIFNDRVWPDYFRLAPAGRSFFHLSILQPLQPIELEGLRITPVPVDHLVPTLGFIVEDTTTAIVLVSDTGPTEQIWKRANATPNLKAVFLEAAFPNEQEKLAIASCHLTPALFALETRKLRTPARYIAVHIKSRFRQQTIDELNALGLPNLEIGRFGKPYVF